MRDDLTGLVLAGGASQRMGADKALLDVGGRPLVAYVAQRLSAVCATVLVAPGDRTLPGLPWERIDDRVAGEGPLAGILGGLAAAGTPLVAVAGVDMPELSPSVYLELAARWDGGPAVVPVRDGRLEPLHAVYATSALAAFAKLFDAGERSPTRALELLGATTHHVDAAGRWAASLNTPQDLARFRDRFDDAPVDRSGAGSPSDRGVERSGETKGLPATGAADYPARAHGDVRRGSHGHRN